MKKFGALLLSLAALALLATCGKTPANVNTAKIISMDGVVTVQKNEASPGQRAYVGTALLPDMILKTGAGARASIQIGDKAVVTVEADAVIRMRDVFKDPTTGQENTKVEFRTGKSMVSLTKKLGAQDSFDVMTPAAVAGVRGTEFLVDVEDPQASKIAVTKGSVVVRQRIAALDDAPSAEMPRAMREALKELAQAQEVPVRVNQEVSMNKAESEKMSQIVEQVVQTAQRQMEAAVKSGASAEQQREQLSAAVTSIVVDSQKRIEEKSKSGELKPAAPVVEMREETRRQVEAIPVPAPVPVETLRQASVSKSENVKDIRQTPEAAAAVPEVKPAAPEAKPVAPEAKPETRVEPRVEARTPAPRSEPVAPAVVAPRAVVNGTIELALATEGAFVSAVGPGGKELSLKPGANSVPPGTWTIKGDRKGFKTFEQSVTVSEGRASAVRVDLIRKIVATEKILLLDGTTISGRIVKQTEDEVTIDTDSGIRTVQKRTVDDIIYLKK